MKPDVYMCEIISRKGLAEGVFELNVVSDALAVQARPGQFVNVKCGRENLLRRPISVCGVFGDEVKLVFEVKGAGTKWLSERRTGELLDIHGPLGKGFDFPKGDIIVVGGGIGCPPMLFAAQKAFLAGTVAAAVIGFRDADSVILRHDFMAYCDPAHFTTDDGSYGIHGTVTGPLEKLLEKGGYDAVFACGPRAMLSAVASICSKHGMPCQVSLEERMACGVGACVVCACATRSGGAEGMSRVCRDGPVFDAETVVWD